MSVRQRDHVKFVQVLTESFVVIYEHIAHHGNLHWDRILADGLKKEKKNPLFLLTETLFWQLGVFI